MGRRVNSESSSSRKKSESGGGDGTPRDEQQKKPWRQESRAPGCRIPKTVKCLRGLPLPLAKEGVKLICSNKQCPYKDELVHSECFEHFEEYLKARLRTVRTAWTEHHINVNLWTPRGYSVVKLLCRCPCDLGYVEPDHDADYAKKKAGDVESLRKRTQSLNIGGKGGAKEKKEHNNNNNNNNNGKQQKAAEKIKKSGEKKKSTVSDSESDEELYEEHRHPTMRTRAASIGAIGKTAFGEWLCRR